MATSVNPFPSLGNTVSLSPLHDAHGRNVRYLRLSVTDRCNLHCLYCRSVEQRDFIPHENILRYEEMARVVRIVHDMGVRKVRLTGGEPFARKGCDDFLAMLHARHDDLDLRLTTNATLLEPHIPLLRRVGVSVVNISLDSFDRATFARVTGHDLLPSVLAAVDGLLVAGLRVKINAVALRGVNDSQLDDFVHAAKTLPVDVRFIECSAQQVRQAVIQVVENALAAGYAAKDVQVLSPRYQGPGGIDVLNQALQEIINPPDAFKHELKVGYRLCCVYI